MSTDEKGLSAESKKAIIIISVVVLLLIIGGVTGYLLLKNGNTDDGVETIKTENGLILTLLDDGNYGVYGYEGKDSQVEIPSSYQDVAVTCILDGAFRGNNTVTKIIIPISVVQVDEKAFENCNNLLQIVCDEKSSFTIDTSDSRTEVVKRHVTHVFKEKITTGAYLSQEATCNRYALYFYSCVCGEKGKDTFSYEEGGYNNHKNIITVAKTDATCAECGYTEGTFCTDCQQYLTGHEICENVKGHAYEKYFGKGYTTAKGIQVSEYKKANCLRDELSVYVCSRCGDGYAEKGESKSGHRVELWKKTAVKKISSSGKCESKISYTGVCLDCEQTVTKEEKVEMHSFVISVSKEATCKEQGEKKTFCTDVNCIYHTTPYRTELFSAEEEGHRWTVASEEGNKRTYSCTLCSREKEGYFSEGNDISLSNVQEIDEISLSCASFQPDSGVLDTIKGSSVQLSAGTIQDSERADALKNLSEEDKRLLGNGTIYSFSLQCEGEGVSQLGGSMKITLPYTLQEGENGEQVVVWYVGENGTEKRDATYFETNGEGFISFETTHFSLYLPATLSNADYCALYGHDTQNAVIKAPDCKEEGYTVCLRCGEKTDTKERTAHTFAEESSLNATCTQEGKKYSKCTVCGEQTEQKIQPTGHRYVVCEKVTATCREKGKIVYQCSYCTDQYTLEQGIGQHIFAETTVACSCQSDGYTQKECTVCAFITYENVQPKKEHLFDDKWKNDAIGHYRVCVYCGEKSETESHIPNRTEATEDFEIKCTVCGYIMENKVGHEHAVKIGVTAVSATCTKEGNIGYYVCECGKSFFDAEMTQEILSMDAVKVAVKGHIEKKIAGKKATCSEKGYTESIQCEECGAVIQNAREIPILTHRYEGTSTLPTCTEGGFVRYRCTLCGEEYTSDLTEAVGHRYTTKTVLPTCTEDGYTEYTCTECGENHRGESMSKLGHHYQDYVKSELGHCQTCTRCGNQSSIANHEPDGEATEERGVYCKVCGYEMQKALPHLCSVKEGIAEKEPTCTESGSIPYYICRCGKLYKDDSCTQEVTASETVLAPKGHRTEEREGEAPSCTQTGTTAGIYCTRCERYLEGHTVLSALGHEEGELYATASCHERKCMRCEEILFSEAHQTDGWYKNESGHYTVCTECGYTSAPFAHTPDYEEATEEHSVLCTECGYVIAPKLNHVHHFTYRQENDRHYLVCSCGEEGEKENCFGGEATCLEKAICSVCGFSYGALAEHTPNGIYLYTANSHSQTCVLCQKACMQEDHTFEDNAVAGTCLEQGYTEKTCTVCRYQTKTDYTPKADHTFGEYIYNNNATCRENGTETATCLFCAETKTREKADSRLPHTFGEKVIENRRDAGCESKGSYEEVSYCTACGEEGERTRTETAVLGHNYDGVPWKTTANGHYVECTRCGKAKEEEPHVPDYAEATEEHGVCCTICGKVLEEQKEHIHVYNQKVIAEEYLAQRAGCATHANYYYSCVCGEKGRDLFVDENGSLAPHELICEIYTDYLATPATCNAKATYYKCCKNCTFVSEETFVDEGGEYADHVPQNAVQENIVPSGCTAKGTYDLVCYCEVCHRELQRMPEEEEPLGHLFGESSYLWENTVCTAERACTRCQEKQREQANGVEIEHINETCTQTGISRLVATFTASYFDSQETERVIDAKGHTPDTVWTAGENNHTLLCTVCQAELETQPHVPDYEEATEDHGICCTVCGKMMEERKEHIHIYNQKKAEEEYLAQPAGCATRANYYYSCVCGEKGSELFVDENSPFAPHELLSEPIDIYCVQPSTCTTHAVYKKFCQNCNFVSEETFVDETSEYADHRTGEGVKENETQATCTANGHYDMIVYCLVCQTELSRDTVMTPATGHVYGTPVYVWAEDVCTATVLCSVDGHVLTERVLGEEESRTEATCEEEGRSTLYALFENAIFSAQVADIALPATGHTPGSEWQGIQIGHYHTCAVCKKALPYEEHLPDYEEATEEHGICCTVCGYVIEQPKQHEHRFDREIVSENALCAEATCKEKAVYYKSCVCGEIGTETFIDENSTLVQPEIRFAGNGTHILHCPSCGEESIEVCTFVEGVCSVCGYVCIHNFIVTGEEQSTCVQEGQRIKTCLLCGRTEREKLPLAEHTYQPVERRNPDCLTDGYIKSKCSICGDSQTTELPKIDHRFVESSESVEETCGQDGLKVSVCEMCGERKTEDIPKTNAHDWGYTDNHDGTHTKKCWVCEQQVTEDCTFEGGICNQCGASEQQQTGDNTPRSVTIYDFTADYYNPPINFVFGNADYYEKDIGYLFVFGEYSFGAFADNGVTCSLNGTILRIEYCEGVYDFTVTIY